MKIFAYYSYSLFSDILHSIRYFDLVACVVVVVFVAVLIVVLVVVFGVIIEACGSGIFFANVDKDIRIEQRISVKECIVWGWVGSVWDFL